MCADAFNLLVEICDGDKYLGVNADPSHCWEGESWETRFIKVAPRIYAAHVKNFVVRSGFALRMMQPNWQKRAMQFTDLASGDLNMSRYVECLVLAGYPQRYREIMKRDTGPLVVEAESAYRDLDATSANGVAFALPMDDRYSSISQAQVIHVFLRSQPPSVPKCFSIAPNRRMRSTEERGHHFRTSLLPE